MLENKISLLRKEKNISQEELARVLNTSRQAISKWERGEAYPDIEKLKDLATFFNVSIDYILDYDIESNSVSFFIKRLEDAIEKNSFDVSIDEIKMIISKNNNDFNLHVKVVNYLGSFITQNKEYIDLIIYFSTKALNIFVPNNSNNVTLNDIHKAIASCLLLKDDCEGAMEYINEHNITGCDLELAECAYKLGDYNKSTYLLSDIFLKSIAEIINGNSIQIRLLFKTNKLDEAYDLINWSINFINSIDKKDDLFQEIIYHLIFCRTCYEKYKGLDYQKSLKFLLDNYDKYIIDQKTNDSDSIKFYYNKKVTITVLTDSFEKDILYLKDSLIYKDAKELYDLVFGGK